MKIKSFTISFTFWFAWNWIPSFHYIPNSGLVYRNYGNGSKKIIPNETNWDEKESSIEIIWLFFKLTLKLSRGNHGNS